MSTHRPLNIAHRGGAGLRPENTLSAFAHALDIGVDGFELDIHIAKDGTVVVFHDDALKPEIVRSADGHRDHHIARDARRGLRPTEGRVLRARCEAGREHEGRPREPRRASPHGPLDAAH